MKSSWIRTCGLTAAALITFSSEAGVNTFTPTGPNGGWSNHVYYIPGSTGVALATNSDGLYRTTDNGLTWTNVLSGFLNVHGRLIVSDPRNPNHVVIQAEQLGIYISEDAGLTFRAIGRYPPNDTFNAGALAYAPNGLALYAGFGTRILRSTDGGATWAATAADLPVPSSGFVRVRDIDFAPNDSDIIYVSMGSTSPGVLKSTNGGQSWAALPLLQPVSNLAIDPTNPNVILASTFNGIQRSVTAGTAWTSVSSEPSILIRFDPVVANRVFAVSESGKVLRSTDAGLNWNVLVDLKLWEVMTWSFDTTVAGRILLGSAEGLLLSEDHGVNWTSRDSNLYGGMFLLETHRASRTVFASGAPGPFGVFARDSVGNWNPLGTASLKSVVGTPPLVYGVRALAVAPSDANLIYGSRNTSILKSTNGGQTWSRPTSDLNNDFVVAIAIDPVIPTTVYAMGSPRAILRSVDGGVTWTPRSSGIPGNDCRQLVIDPSNTSTLYATTVDRRLYKSTDAGLNWNELTIPTTATIFYRLSIDPSNSNTLYLPTTDGLYRSENAGVAWSKVGNGNTTSKIVFDLDNANVMLQSSFSGPATQRSVDGGTTWESIANPTTFSAGEVIIDPRNPANIFLSAPYKGIYQLEIAPNLDLQSFSSLLANGSQQTISMTLTNRGPYAATNVALAIDLPPSTTSLTVQTTRGTCTTNALHADCTYPNLKLNETATITLSGSMTVSGERFAATVSARESDPVPTNNSVTITTTTPPPPPAPPAPSSGGGRLQWSWVLILLSLGIVRVRGGSIGHARLRDR